MSASSKDEKPSSTNDDDIDRLARQMLLEEAKRNKIRAETQGALGWRKPTVTTNRKFLRNTLISNAVHNIHRNEQEKHQRLKSTMERKRSRSPPISRKTRTNDDDDDDDGKPSSKRTTKDK